MAVEHIDASDMLVIDPGESATPCAPEGPRFVVLIIGEGELDASTFAVFEEAARVTTEALLDLGASAADVRWCPDLRYCTFRAGPSVEITLVES